MSQANIFTLDHLDQAYISALEQAHISALERAYISALEQAHISTLEQAHMINNNWLMIIGSSLQPVDPPDGLLLCPVLLQPGLHTDRRQDQELYTTWLDRPGASL